MATVLFYEKPGCLNNIRQKALLQASGHCVLAYNLLLEPWTPERLTLFFAGLPVAQWFNTTARAITTGLVVPEQLDPKTALALMVLDPGLIRRPLLQVGDQRLVGFDLEVVDRWIGLGAALSPAGVASIDLTRCPKAAQLVTAGRCLPQEGLA
jgi:nitrogenase-associated protein